MAILDGRRGNWKASEKSGDIGHTIMNSPSIQTVGFENNDPDSCSLFQRETSISISPLGESSDKDDFIPDKETAA